MIPNLDNLEVCHDYLRDLGAKHQQHGVRREHLDLMALVYCSAIRGVVATQGKFSIFPKKIQVFLGGRQGVMGMVLKIIGFWGGFER